MNLNEVAGQLNAHFTQVHRTKQEEGVGDPVFALEHPFTLGQVDELALELSRTVRTSRGLREQDWLAWVVHAAEQGYGFGGLQYWDSFAAATPGWSEFGDRDLLRTWFNRFQQRYGGLRPTGHWSGTYTYICWPVGHALLPRDLQRQLAESIYNARYELELAPILPPGDLGRLIARHTYRPSTRFAGFLEQADLAGRIVRALLAEGSAQQRTIYAPTLDRISQDMSDLAHARDWMHDARKHYAAAAFRMRHGARQAAAEPPEADTPVSRVTSPDMAPRLTLQRIGVSQWRAHLAPPSLLGLCATQPELRGVIHSGRFRIDAHGDRLMPSAGLLVGQPVPRPLVRWPQEREVVLRFDPPQPALEQTLASICHVPAGPIWVFRLRDRDLAEANGRLVVFPGQSYIVCSRDTARVADLGEPVDLGLADLSGVRMDLPPVVSASLRAQLQRAGLELRQTIRVTPMGLTPRRWSSAGEGEWLTTEQPIFLLERDHALDRYTLRLDENAPVVVTCESDQPVIVALDRLGTGPHTLTIQAHEGACDVRSPWGRVTASCEISLTCRHPAAWLPGTSYSESFIVDVSPREPSLEDLFSGRVQVHVEGDPARSVMCHLVLEDSAGDEWWSEELFAHRFPISTMTWSQAVAKLLQHLTDDEEWFAAASAHLLFDAGDLGTHRVPLMLDAKPVRWALRRDGKRLTLRVIDEAPTDAYVANCYALATPTTPEPLAMNLLLAGMDVSSRGGLYALTSPEGVQTIVIVPVEKQIGLQQLGAGIDLAALEQVNDAGLLSELIARWQSARASQAFARLKQRAVVNALHRQLLRVVCGPDWMRLEDRLSATAPTELWERLDRAVAPTGSQSFAITLSRLQTVEHVGAGELSSRFCAIAEAYKLPTVECPATLAWIIANSPERLVECGNWEAWLQHGAARTMVRGARLLERGQDLGRGNDP